MIPDFDKNGKLPPGEHEATLKEFEVRFANTIYRKELFNKMLGLIEELKRIKCKTIYVDGSYITDKSLPGDIDICWEDHEIDYEFVEKAMPILFDLDYPRTAQQTMYGADIFPAHLEEGSTGMYFIDFFQTDKETGLQKGIVKIKI